MPSGDHISRDEKKEIVSYYIDNPGKTLQEIGNFFGYAGNTVSKIITDGLKERTANNN